MTIEKLPSGSYRIKEMHKGKMYSLTVKQKPSDRVARKLLDEKIENSTIYGGNTFKSAADTYIEAKNNIGQYNFVDNFVDNFEIIFITFQY